ncbi:MAG: hypothetical protein HQK97_03290 [Nitrospirae bacterium]|nr:hypothetical protein [Nitrospirota bacterium]
MRHKDNTTGSALKARALKAVASAAALLMLCGCAAYKPTERALTGPPSGPYPGYSGTMYNVYNDLDAAARDMANGLSFSARVETETVYSPQISPILITTFVDINDVRQTSALGRAFSELLMTYLQLNYFDVKEIRMGNVIDMDKKNGEFVLTRDIKDLAARENAMSVLVGTYTVTGQSVIFNGRIINLKDSMLYSAWSTRMVQTKELRKLLNQNRGLLPDSAPVFERPPVTTK